MFARFRQTPRRLQVSLSATSRINGTVRHEHIASLGSVPLAMTIADRMAFWAKLHQRLQRLANRLDATQQASVMGAIYARIAMPTPDEQQAELIERARQDAEQWQQIAEMGSEQAEGLKGLAERTQQQAAAVARQAADSRAHADAAKARLAKVEAGEVVPVPKPLTCAEMLRISGMTEAQARAAMQVHEIAEAGGFEVLLNEVHIRKEKAERSAKRAMHRRLVQTAHLRSDQR